jgi:hypothetical protein
MHLLRFFIGAYRSTLRSLEMTGLARIGFGKIRVGNTTSDQGVGSSRESPLKAVSIEIALRKNFFESASPYMKANLAFGSSGMAVFAVDLVRSKDILGTRGKKW